MAQGYLIFHLNLAFSSIKTEARLEVIRKCYWPLLRLAESTGIPVGVELTGWTLQQIAQLDPSWVDHFRHLLQIRQCELIGSGWSQVIGPLVPYEVNHWNQKLGMEAYQQTLGVTPTLALVNEMAFSSGMVDVYAQAGYLGIVMDRDNVRLALGLVDTALSTTPSHALGCERLALPVLWSDSILFQRMQRVVHGDIPVAEYMAYVTQRAGQDHAVLPIYCNDAEIFDYRPGRFTTEALLHSEGEWERLQRVCRQLRQELHMDWLSPAQALQVQADASNPTSRRLTSASHPIPVKKQAKYNINRWAITGRDDLWLNTSCHQIHQALAHRGVASNAAWRELCELWASDLRTHITADRWDAALKGVAEVKRQLGLEVQGGELSEDVASWHALGDISLPQGVQIDQDEEGIHWTITTPTLHLVLNMRRGLAIKSLAFGSHEYQPVVGTLAQGYFSTIALGADFYSGGVLVEIPGDRNRATDLEWVKPNICQQGNQILISAAIPMAQGILTKTVTVDTAHERVKLSYRFEGFERPLGVVRVGIVTLIPESFSGPLTVSCVNGGPKAEVFNVEHDVNHGVAASPLVSSSTAFAATDGQLVIADATSRKLVLRWNPAECAAIPMLKHQPSQGRHLTRISFSLSELDDTARAGGRLLPFSVDLSAA